MNRLMITIPGAPKRKERPRFNTRTGSVFTPRTTTDAEEAIAQEVKAQFVGWGEPPYVPDGEVRVTVWFVTHKNPKNPAGRMDVDNCAKLVMDALNKIVWADDSQVSDLMAFIRRGKEYGPERTVITLEWDAATEEDAA